MKITNSAITIPILVTILLLSFYGSSKELRVQSATSEDWPMFHHDPAHTGYTTSQGPITIPTKVWSYHIKQSNNYNTSIGASPAVANGYLYINNDKGTFFCLNASTGTPIWNNTGGGQYYSSPAVDSGIVYTGYSGITAYNASTGDTLWNYNVVGSLGHSVSISDGVAYTSSGEHLFALNASTGATLWNTTPNGGTPALAYGYVYGGTSGKVYAYNVSTGELAWNNTVAVEAVGFYSPSIADGRVYISSALSNDNRVYCFDALTGAHMWNYTTGSWVRTSPAVVGGIVYAGSNDGNIYALNASNGNKIWSFKTGVQPGETGANGGFVGSSPAVAGGIVYVGSLDGNVYALDALTLSLIHI